MNHENSFGPPEGLANDDLLGYGCFTGSTKQSLTYASLCDETSIRALISDDFTENGKCNFYTIADRFLVTSGVMAFQVHIPSLQRD